MKILELCLQAFGSFSERRLDFGDGRGLFVVYGRNEAGKSTALRAVTDLLYGIPPKTRDAHMHAMKDLRIGAKLQNGSTESVELIRRKGLKGTLLSPSGAVLDDAVMDAVLGGVNRAMFESVFGLTNDSLRAGAQALLEGSGSVGESLFEAGVGTAGVHQIVGSLKEDADALFTPRGRGRKHINSALTELKELRAQLTGSMLGAKAFLEQEASLTEAREKQLSLSEGRSRLDVERHRLMRLRRVLPLLGRLRQWELERDALGEIRPAIVEGSRVRQAALTETRECEAQIVRLSSELSDQRERADAIGPEKELLRVDESAIDELSTELGKYQSWQRDIPLRRGELRALEEDIDTLRSQVGANGREDGTSNREDGTSNREDGTSNLVDLILAGRVRTLAAKQSGLERDRAHASSQLRANERRLANLPKGTKGAEIRTTAGLRGAVNAARGARELVRRREEQRAVLEQGRLHFQSRIEALGISAGFVDGARAPAVPSAEALERAIAATQRLDQERSRLSDEQRAAETRLREVERDIDKLTRAGDVPTEEVLDRARQNRDESFAPVREAAAGRAEPVDSADYEQSVREVDHVADRLRREAERVARLVADEAELTHLNKLGKDFTERREAADEAERDAHSAWRSLWAADFSELANFDVPPPVDARPWLRRYDELCRMLPEMERHRVDVAKHAQECSNLRTALSAELAQLETNDVGGSGGDELISLLVRGEELCRREADSELERSRLLAERTSLEEARQLARAEADEAAASYGSWSTEWGEAMQQLNLPSTATPDEATAVLEHYSRLDNKNEQIRKMRRRIDGMLQLAGEFESLLARVSGLSSSPDGGMPQEQARAVIAEYRQARQMATDGRRLAGEIREKRLQLEEYERRKSQAAQQLEDLMLAASSETREVKSLDDLVAAEERAARAIALDGQIVEQQRELDVEGEGAKLEDLVAESSAVNRDELAARLDQIEEEMRSLDEAIEQNATFIGRVETGLQHMGGDPAADIASAFAQQAAKTADFVQRYVRLRLGALILDQEIERYKELNQGPILKRANELFPVLTVGHYTGLRIGRDDKDEQRLVCVRADCKEVEISGLSSGTADQLYLALRLASLERFGAVNDPMPVVLDDILLHFDDERAAAALSVLGQFSRHCQVLFFTHHERLLDLARQVVKPEIFHEIRLETQ